MIKGAIVVPIGTGESKLSPALLLAFPLQNPAVSDAGVWPSAVRVKNQTLRPDGTGDVDYPRCVEVILGSRNMGRRKKGLRVEEGEDDGEECKQGCSCKKPWVHSQSEKWNSGRKKQRRRECCALFPCPSTLFTSSALNFETPKHFCQQHVSQTNVWQRILFSEIIIIKILIIIIVLFNYKNKNTTTCVCSE